MGLVSLVRVRVVCMSMLLLQNSGDGSFAASALGNMVAGKASIVIGICNRLHLLRTGVDLRCRKDARHSERREGEREAEMCEANGMGLPSFACCGRRLRQRPLRGRGRVFHCLGGLTKRSPRVWLAEG